MLKNLLLMKSFQPFMMAEDGAGAGNGSGGNGGSPDGGQNPEKNNGDQGAGEKQFTQEDLNRIASAEHKKGASSVYKNFNFESEEAMKSFVEKYRNIEEEQKTDLEKANSNLSQTNATLSATQLKLQEATHKLTVIEKGANPESAGDVALLAGAMVSDDVTFEQAVEKIKIKYPTLFSNSNSGSGTGSTGNGAGGDAVVVDGIGSKLAKMNSSASNSKWFK